MNSYNKPPKKFRVATDINFFTVRDNKLQICLIEREDTKEWALPGGFLQKDEDWIAM